MYGNSVFYEKFTGMWELIEFLVRALICAWDPIFSSITDRSRFNFEDVPVENTLLPYNGIETDFAGFWQEFDFAI